jgi:hypothetical protein
MVPAQELAEPHLLPATQVTWTTMTMTMMTTMTMTMMTTMTMTMTMTMMTTMTTRPLPGNQIV